MACLTQYACAGGATEIGSAEMRQGSARRIAVVSPETVQSHCAKHSTATCTAPARDGTQWAVALSLYAVGIPQQLWRVYPSFLGRRTIAAVWIC